MSPLSAGTSPLLPRRRAATVLAAAVVVLAVACSSGGDGDPAATEFADEGATVTAAGGPEPAPTTSAVPVPSPEVADDIHVSLDGDDDAPGTTTDAPLRTMEQAVALAGPGDTIHIGAGIWPRLVVRDLAGAPDAPVTFRPAAGAEGAVRFSHGDPATEFAIWIERSSSLVLDGLVAGDALWGIRILASTDVTVRNSVVTDTGQEAIAVQDGSSGILLEGNLVRRTGLVRPQYGEGIYLGSGGDEPDPVNRVVIRGNELTELTAEAIDVKPFVTDVVVEGNRIHNVATATSGAVVVGIGTRFYEDPNVVIRGNRISDVTTTSPYTDGNGISLSAPATVVNNVIWNVQHRGILADGNFVNPAARTVRIHHNTVWGWGVAAIDIWSGPNAAEADVRCNVGPDLPGNVAATADLFVDVAAADLRLTPAATAAIDACGPLGTVDDDIDGAPRDAAPDMGAYEVVAPGATTDG